MVFISVVAIFLTWVLFFIDRRNQYLFRRATDVASVIETYFNIPSEMGLHSNKPMVRKKLSHSKIFIFLTIMFTIFWVIFLFFNKKFIY